MKTESRTRLIHFLIGSLIGLLVFLLIYGVSPLNVTRDDFLRGGYIEQDVRQHYAGWLFYRQAPLRIPFSIAPQINWPDGMSIAFTDSIPLFAAAARLIVPILPETFQYFGWFTLICFMLQGGFGALLTSLFSQNRCVTALGALLFSFSPILLERAFRHTSLAAHFLILAALYYYLLGCRQNRYTWPGLFLLNCITIAIHPYFVPMTFAVTFALLAGYVVRNRRIAGPAGFLAANLAGCLATGWLFGTFYGAASGSGGSGISYGYFCMNLNALWNPVSRGVVWSSFLPVQNQTLGNYDGFNYLGLGLLLGLIAALLYLLIAQRSQLQGLLRRHGWLIFVCLCLTLFAISPVITANGAVLARLPLPQVIINLATTLRSSGRLFWPVYYLLFLFILRELIALGRQIHPHAGSALVLALVCGVQLLDLRPALAVKAASLRNYQPVVADTVTGTTPSLCETSNFFHLIAGRYRHLVALDPLTRTGISLALYTADQGMTNTDTSFLARYNAAQTDAQQAKVLDALAAGQLDPESVYVTENETLFLRVADAAQATGAWCAALQAQDDTEAQTVLYVIAPNFDGSGVTHAVPFNDTYPLHLADLSDDFWSHGVLCLNLEQIGREADANKVVGFYDTPLLRRRLANAKALRANGVDYPILAVDDHDPGWVMLTLDIDNAQILIGQDLEFVP